MNQQKKDSFQALLDIACKPLHNFHHREKNRKNQWKIQQSNAAFNKNALKFHLIDLNLTH